MPNVREILLKEGSIEVTLARAQSALLPEEMSNDPLAGWMLRFAEPRAEHFRGRATDDSRNPILATLTREVREKVLQPTLSYYHAALMHVGLQWAVANEGLARAQAILDGDNLELSVRDADKKLTAIGEIQPDSRGIVVGFARQLDEVWSERSKLARSAWAIWLDEVGDLQRTMRRAEDSFHHTDEQSLADLFQLLYRCLEPSQLSYHGFPDRRELSFGKVLSLVSLAGLCTLSGATREFGRDWRGRFDYFEEFLHRLEHAEDRRARVPIIIEEMRALEAEYPPGFDPFAPYYSEFGILDLALIRIAARHRLYDHTPSRWLRAFKGALRTLSAWPLDVVRFSEGEGLEAWIHWGAITADAEIKGYFVSHIRTFHQGSLQEAYEQEWVLSVARKLFDKGAKPNSTSADRFCQLVAQVTAEIVRRGYAVNAPTEGRLRKLIARIGERGYFVGEW